MHTLRELMTKQRNKLGEAHPTTLQTTTQLALAHARLGEFSTGIPLLRQALRMLMQTLGPKDHATLTCMRNLGSMLADSAEFQPAIELLKAVRWVTTSVAQAHASAALMNRYHKLYEERATGELTVSRLNELMVETQREVFGPVLEEGGEDPYFWASKLHFFITGVTFYNFPYTFGFLLSRGLFSMFKEEGAAFLPRYEEFLRLTGSDNAEGVAKKALGRDLEDPQFWVEAIQSLAEPLAELEKLQPDIISEHN